METPYEITESENRYIDGFIDSNLVSEVIPESKKLGAHLESEEYNTLIEIPEKEVEDKKEDESDGIEPVRVDDRGEWYSMKQMCQKMKRTPERIRQMVLSDNPVIIKDTSLGVILYRLSAGWEFSKRGGIIEIQ